MGATIIVAFALPLAAVARQTPPLGSADDGQIAVGMACSDGTFTPLATWDGRAWRSLLRELEAVSFFAALTPEAQRLPRLGWTFFPNGAERRQPLVLGAPRPGALQNAGACGEVQAYDAAALRRPQRPDRRHEIVGYGMLGAAQFEFLEDVTGQPDDDSRQVAQRVVQEVRAAERRLTRRAANPSPLGPVSQRRRASSEVRLIELKRDPRLDGDWYFFQARASRTGASVLVHGWMRAAGQLSTFRVVAAIEDDTDGKATELLSAAGIIRLSDRDVWIASVSGYEWHSYRFFEIGPGADGATPRPGSRGYATQGYDVATRLQLSENTPQPTRGEVRRRPRYGSASPLHFEKETSRFETRSGHRYPAIAVDDSRR